MISFVPHFDSNIVDLKELPSSCQDESYILHEIPYFEGSYEEFVSNHLLKNLPCIIANATKNWNCLASWVKNNEPDFVYLESQYGDIEVPVAICNEKYFNSQMKTTMLFKEYINYWRNFIKNGYPSSEQCLYLKVLTHWTSKCITSTIISYDWHFMKNNPDESIYKVLKEFSSDWLNEYYESKSDDYRFVYMGPKGSWTPFHADVFTSYSWSVNICGEKKWILLPPGEEHKLRDNFGELPYDISDVDCNNNNNVKFFSVIQKVGDAIFVPSGWHHQVWNTLDTISVNHNWINGCNINRIWQSLKSNLKEVKNEIQAFKYSMENWEEHCQLILKSCFGMNFVDFYRFINDILETRKKNSLNGKLLTLYNGWKIGLQQIRYDLIQLQTVLQNFENDEDVKLFLSEKNAKILTDFY